MDELRTVLMGNAFQIALSMGSDALVEDNLGIGLEDQSLGSAYPLSPDELRRIDLGRFRVARQIGWAFDYAFQTESDAERGAFSDDD